ncbi:DEAD/DEAH box helicase [Actinokineospora sp. G85]|uniref:DEAD/DEAH box helicase n=1 Tax=Actinokineospora sp. G85 TaxID=3406626 RepID=UPI003C75281E
MRREAEPLKAGGQSALQAVDSTIAGIAWARWGVELPRGRGRFGEDGWAYEHAVAFPCPVCTGELHTMRKPYQSAGKDYRFIAIVCPACPTVSDLADLGLKRYSQLLKPPAPQPRASPAPRTSTDDVPETTIDALVRQRWGVDLRALPRWFDTPGWWYEGASTRGCPECAKPLHAFRKIYDGPNRKPGKKAGHLVAVVCPACPAAHRLRDLGLRTFEQFMAPEEPAAPTAGSEQRGFGCEVEPGEVRVRAIRGRDVDRYIAQLFGKPGARVIASGNGGLGTEEVEHRLLHWVKTTNPRTRIPRQPPSADVRVLLPLGPEFDALRARLTDAGIAWRQVRHWIEDEVVSTVGMGGELAPLQVRTKLPPVGSHDPHGADDIQVGRAAVAARDAFDMVWQVHDAPATAEWTSVAAADLVPPEWVPYLPFPTFNPAQAQAAPVIADSRDHVLVTAPTGAGKTVIGMLAVVKALIAQGRKAAWLVPQRSLTDELERELRSWRDLGLQVEWLSGEHVTDLRKIREADLWIATTEKFESVCRTASLRAALAEVACLVVDEIHLLGDPVRGPLLEALLARVRGADSPVRIVGLSATVANAADVADWLGARLLTTTWRPSLLTWQLPIIPATTNRAVEQAARTGVAVSITDAISRDGGSVLVFCGSRRNVRETALAIASARGINTRGVHADDLDRLERVCTAAKVGLHYKDWQYKGAAERGFRNRELDVLVATTTVAAGVNLPARAVVVRDTQLGTTTMGVATVLQMFGRAGRVGAGETEGWAYLVTTEGERPLWQQRLVDGHTVRSNIQTVLPDHLLAEAAQDRLHSVADAEHWWVRTLANHQGTRDVTPVHAALDLLREEGFLTEVTQDDDSVTLAVTELGKLTTQLMVGVQVGIDIAAHLAKQELPTTPDAAEALLIRAVSTQVPQLAEAPVVEALRPLVARLHRARGRPELIDKLPPQPGLAPVTACDPGDLAQVAMLLVANSPTALAHAQRAVAGVPKSILHPVLAEAPRYFAWLAGQGRLGTVHPWIAVAAADLGRRIRWRGTAAPRGAGRLLWICEQMATREHAEHLVPRLYRAARDASLTSPDWPLGAAPELCRLDRADYLALLRERCTGTSVTVNDKGEAVVTKPIGAMVSTWTETDHTLSTTGAAHGQYSFPHPPGANTSRGVTIFTRRGDHYSDGWTADYNRIKEH